MRVTLLTLMSSRRKRRVDEIVGEPGYLNKCEQVCEQLRELQWRTNCSTKTLQCLLDSLRGKLGRLVKESDDLPRKPTCADKKMQKMVRIIPIFLLPLQSNNCAFRLERGRCSCMVVWVLVKQKSGNRKIQQTYVNCVAPGVTTTKETPGSSSFTFL